MNLYDRSKNYDSLVVVCKQLLSSNIIYAKQELADFHLADAYHELKQYDRSLKYGKRFLRRPATKLTYRGMRLNLYKRLVCKNFYKMYLEQGNLRKAVSYLRRMDQRHDVYMDGRMRRVWRKKMYPKMIDHYTELGNENLAKVYQKKLWDLENYN